MKARRLSEGTGWLGMDDLLAGVHGTAAQRPPRGLCGPPVS
jgi:hypothetical protein